MQVHRRWLLLAFGIPAGAFADDAVSARVEARIDAAVAESAQLARESVLADLRRALAGGAPAALPSPAVASALAAVREEDLRDEVAFLASERLEGRNAGYAGNDRAAEHLADAFARLGLGPAGDDKTFFQRFSFTPRGESSAKETRNVLGLLPGSDDRRRGEIVVVGAHFDHVGREGQSNPGRLGRAREGDDVWNGADDNASGTATLLAVARAFTTLPVRPRRTILFAAFSAEEYGLLGSRHYVKHPVAPLEDHAAMINLDMVGRNPGRPLTVAETDTAAGELFTRLLGEANAGVGLDLRLPTTSLFTGGSDHSTFHAKKIPVAFFFTGLHLDYHGVADESDRIAYGRMAKIARLTFLFTRAVADGEERPRFAGPAADSK